MLKLPIRAEMAESEGELKRTTIFLTTEQREWLDQIRADSIRAHDEISVSAVVRLALSRLASTFPAWTDIRQQLPHSESPSGPGRPRR